MVYIIHDEGEYNIFSSETNDLCLNSTEFVKTTPHQKLCILF